ncbi:hypothetical protein JZ751_028709 [Albula glossodonta]|uniref:WH1 domain-containing protein n=1 Tax=Albula glossodonta TaxID=121402 RepID=A0A8T2MP29_9TELE|nr:hypothetical protein JZ751_028709 [Albula glossodonta]
MQDCQAGLNFASEQEAESFREIVEEKINQRVNRQEKRQLPPVPGSERDGLPPLPAPNGPARMGSMSAPSRAMMDIQNPDIQASRYRAAPAPAISSRTSSKVKKEKKSKKKGSKLSKADIGAPSGFTFQSADTAFLTQLHSRPDRGQTRPHLPRPQAGRGPSPLFLAALAPPPLPHVAAQGPSPLGQSQREGRPSRSPRPPLTQSTPPPPTRSSPPAPSLRQEQPPPPPPTNHPPPPSAHHPPPPPLHTTLPPPLCTHPPHPPLHTHPPPPPHPLHTTLPPPLHTTHPLPPLTPSPPPSAHHHTPPPSAHTTPPRPPQASIVLLVLPSPCSIRSPRGSCTSSPTSPTPFSRPAPPSPVGGGRGALLDQIRLGKKLKNVTENAEPPPPPQDSSGEGIVGALMMVMQKRSKVIHSSVAKPLSSPALPSLLPFGLSADRAVEKGLSRDAVSGDVVSGMSRDAGCGERDEQGCGEQDEQGCGELSGMSRDAVSGMSRDVVTGMSRDAVS